jgi:hypothetical protein
MDKWKQHLEHPMEEHFTTFKHYNHHYYHNIMYHQRFIFNFNLNFIILNEFEKKIMEYFSLYL